ncbi:MAG: SDR family oxidoreductase [Myxococcota bacterium]
MNNRTLPGRITLCTGAAGSIGRAICRRLLDEGDIIVAVDKNEDGLGRLRETLAVADERLHLLGVDVTDAEALARGLEPITRTTGPVQLLINNAGGNRTTLLEETSIHDWKADIELNLNAAFYVFQQVLPGMLAAGRGCVLNIGSVNGLSTYGDPAYSAAKAGLISFTRSIATEYGRRGIRANIICPGTVKTEAWDEMLRQKPELFERLSAMCSLGDIATPEDVAACVRFLASDEARLIHGSTLVIDGGLTAGVPTVMNEFTND